MNRVLARTGARDPIIQASMGWAAHSALASAVSRAGGLRSIETSSGETAYCQREITLMAASGLPFGVNLQIQFLKNDAMLRFVCDALADLPIRFVTTSAGSPAKFIALPHRGWHRARAARCRPSCCPGRSAGGCSIGRRLLYPSAPPCPRRGRHAAFAAPIEQRPEHQRAVDVFVDETHQHLLADAQDVRRPFRASACALAWPSSA